MIDYKYIGNRWIYKLIKQLHEIITVKVADRTRKTLLKLLPKQAKKTLGILISMDENSKD